MKNKGKICKEDNCGKPANSKLYCKVHYNKYCKKPHWIMSNTKEYYRKYRTTILKRRKDKGIKSITGMRKLRFGGLREEVLKRDNFQCVHCGMSSEEHKNRWGRELTLDHIDGQGRYSIEPNNDLSNLQTLCLRCHGKKDVQRKFIGEVVS